MKTKNLTKYAAPVLRIGMSLIFFWFAINQFLDPEVWEGFIPSQLTDILNISARNFVLANATFEIIFAGLLLLGIYVRFAALLLALHLGGIVFSLGYNAIAIRDLGLMFSTFAIFLHGPDQISVMKK